MKAILSIYVASERTGTVNINTKSSAGPSIIPKRKQDHIDVCKSGSGSNIESKASCGFEALQFLHHALPELSCNELSTKIPFLGKSIALPLFISCMTGGSEEGRKANKELAKAAQKMNIPFGLGSMRVLLSNPERIQDFSMRPFAPDIPILGNIGAVQLRDTPHAKLAELIKSLELDALAVHLNCGQELFQEEGDRDFTGLKQAIGDAVETFNLPIIVKETGFGVRPSLVKELIDLGVAYVDLAGAGGTNWILVEENTRSTGASNEFANWGLSTPVLLDAVNAFPGKVLASGGLRSGMDLAKTIALGAVAGGIALPFIQSALDGGEEAVCQQIEKIKQTLLSVLTLTGCQNVDQLRKAPLLRSLKFSHYVTSLKAIEFSS